MSIIVCNIACTGTRKLAQNAATQEFEIIIINEGEVDRNLFRGPVLVAENGARYVFQWESIVPKPGATIIEVSVPKGLWSNPCLISKGLRADCLYLCGTKNFSFSEAMLNYIFGLPISKEFVSKRQKRIVSEKLTPSQQEDAANFVEIKHDLMEYAACNNNNYPDSLDEFNDIDKNKFPENCGAFRLDSIYTHDRYGHEYYYLNLIDFVILGTSGKNEKWDFDTVLLDSMFDDREERILKTDDDIMVKFKPAP